MPVLVHGPSRFVDSTDIVVHADVVAIDLDRLRIARIRAPTTSGRGFQQKYLEAMTRPPELTKVSGAFSSEM